jgi:hypothetical protein
MANENRPSGLSPVNMITGAPYNGQARLYCILAAQTGAFAIGDPVITDTVGGADADGVPAITNAIATGPLRGVIVGLAETKGAGAIISNPNSTIRSAGAKAINWYAMVVDDPTVVFEVQEIGTGTALTAADIGLNADLVPGVNNGFVSGWMLGNTTEAVTIGLQVRLLGLAQRPDNAFGPFAKHLVKINNHELAAGNVGI